MAHSAYRDCGIPIHFEAEFQTIKNHGGIHGDCRGPETNQRRESSCYSTCPREKRSANDNIKELLQDTGTRVRPRKIEELLETILSLKQGVVLRLAEHPTLHPLDPNLEPHDRQLTLRLSRQPQRPCERIARTKHTHRLGTGHSLPYLITNT
jgi:hypothetical protein